MPHRQQSADRAAPELAVCGRALLEWYGDEPQVRLALYGELDLASARELDAEHLAPLLSSKSPVTVDLAPLSELDRPAMEVLLHRQRLAQLEGRRLIIRLTAHQSALVG